MRPRSNAGASVAGGLTGSCLAQPTGCGAGAPGVGPGFAGADGSLGPATFSVACSASSLQQVQHVATQPVNEAQRNMGFNV